MTPGGERRWSSSVMFFAAAIGSAVGISNVWKFTFVAGENGGGAFVLIYVAAVALIALPALIAEFLVGRRGGASVVRGMALLHQRDGIGRAWHWYGLMAAIGAFVALSFYAVVAGWTVDYFVHAVLRPASGTTVERAAAELDALFASPGRMMLAQLAFLSATGVTVAAGVRRGLERALGWLTPTLFLLLLALLAYAVVAGDFAAGLRFMFVPDFSRITGAIVLTAVGQAFFSLGIGLGVLFTLGAYMDDKTSVVRAGIVVAAADVGVALLAGMAVFPIVFANGLSPAEGPGLIFATLPVAFGQMPGGLVVAPLFFALMAIAALTSAITIAETVVAAVEDYSRWPRWRISLVLTVSLWFVGLGTVYSFNRLAEFHPLGFLPVFADRNIFESLDYVVSNFMMPVGGVLVAILASWSLRREVSAQAFTGSTRAFQVWLVLTRYVAPVAITLVFVVNL
ncbi:MAG: sodium-dependent transporter [Pseudomonadota bacterium]